MDKNSIITVFLPGYEPATYDLDSFGKETVRFGRGDLHGSDKSVANDISVPNDVVFVSRAHCTFFKSDEHWYIFDDNSANGLNFNGVKIFSQMMSDGDKYYVGKDVNERLVISYSIGESASDYSSQKHELNKNGKYIIGRDVSCNLVLDHPSVSRWHCIITGENGNYYAEDNNSTNGVILNGIPLKGKVRLNQMDKLIIADTTFIFTDGTIYLQKQTGGVSVSVRDISKEVKIKGGTKYITNGVSLNIEPGEFVAIIGGSGAGKTTLLNCISGMTTFTSGDVFINGESIRTGEKSLRSLMGYVPQNDIVYDNLTLERMLMYSAKLRMPIDTSKDEIKKKIEETLELVELTAHRKTRISRLSGGQKKRASIAVELLASPKLFFLDEPSSGLDPGTEKHLMQMLKKLSETGKTVIMVTHTVQNIGICDRLICMGNGGLLCYSGKPADAVDFFGKKDITDIYDDLNEHSDEVSSKFMSQEANKVSSESNENEGISDVPRKGMKLELRKSFKQFCVMTSRYAEIIINDRPRLLLLLLMPFALTILVCIAFQADGNIYNYLGIIIDRDCLPFLVAGDTMKLMFAFSCAAFWIGIFNSVQEISKERIIFEREKFTGVRAMPYIISKIIVIGFICILQTLVMHLLFIRLSDTTATVDGNINSLTALEISMNENGAVLNSLSLELFITTFLCVVSAMCIGLLISSSVSNDMALILCPVFLLPQILFSGVASTLSGITETISKIITCRWACIAYFTSSNINGMYESVRYEMGSWSKTEYSTGFGIDEAYSITTTYLGNLDPVKSAWAVLGIMSIICIAVSIIILKFRRVKR